MTGEAASDRCVIDVSGKDRVSFLQGLVTNDVTRLKSGLVYAALLSAQGKYLADFFLVPGEERILIDIHQSLADAFMRRLSMYRLRADVTLSSSPLLVTRGIGPVPPGAFADPRHPELGWRRYSENPGVAPSINWDAIRVAHCIPETGIELIPDDSYILECGFERLGGVDFRKGCYVGQEVTARMKHKTELRKGLVTVLIDGEAPVGSEVFASEKTAGRIFTQSDGKGIAYLRFDRAEGPMTAGAAKIRLP
jgi:folate-binding protein YgfZ